MIRFRTGTIALAVAASALVARGRSAPLSAFASDAFVADVAQLRAALEEGDPSLYRHRTKALVDSAFSALRDSAVGTTSQTDFWRHVTRTLAFFRDGHLTALPSGTLWGHVFTRPIPFTMRLAHGRLYVRRALAAEGTPPAGSEILSVNGMTGAKFIAYCAAHISADGTLPTRAYRLIERDFDRVCALALGSPTRYVIEFTPPGDARVHVDTIATMTSATPRAPRQPSVPPGQLVLHPGEHLAVLTLHTFSKSSAFNPEAFMNRAFRTIADSGIAALVIDLRENGGGRDGIGAQLFSHVALDTFTYARRIALRRNFSFGDWILNWRIRLFISTRALPDGRLALDEALDRTQRPARNAFRGRVFVLADRSTFSTASEVVALMQEYGRATIVGEETATGREGDSGATTGIMLKNSGIIIDVPIVRYDLPYANGKVAGRGVFPDVPAEPTIEDLLAGRDVAMAAALKLARAR